jgi:hypothetical protein
VHDDPHPYSHAYFPKSDFDQISQKGNWTFGRKGDGYIALYSQTPAVWASDGPSANIELRASSPDNVWICEMGNASQSGSFDAFVDKIQESGGSAEGFSVKYQSAAVGCIEFSWTGALNVSGEAIPLDNYPASTIPIARANLATASIR